MHYLFLFILSVKVDRISKHDLKPDFYIFLVLLLIVLFYIFSYVRQKASKPHLHSRFHLLTLNNFDSDINVDVITL